MLDLYKDQYPSASGYELESQKKAITRLLEEYELPALLELFIETRSWTALLGRPVGIDENQARELRDRITSYK